MATEHVTRWRQRVVEMGVCGARSNSGRRIIVVAVVVELVMTGSYLSSAALRRKTRSRFYFSVNQRASTAVI